MGKNNSVNNLQNDNTTRPCMLATMSTVLQFIKTHDGKSQGQEQPCSDHRVSYTTAKRANIMFYPSCCYGDS